MLFKSSPTNHIAGLKKPSHQLNDKDHANNKQTYGQMDKLKSYKLITFDGSSIIAMYGPANI